ncbi:uncharacterized protein ACA1_386370 [Acanthamoeba castellanii str. Neff]|uniref:Uncharacterized protein n=1 Tax=Acanthamoeba castellanii (strain ATCC 30010 / Neff) TaxID=1257118 RepID=L8H8J2_ACACF|nr:uncharacterized protein ACA1_386370 [Acanthamoeba castellanii str. Neff]ELR21829.1 hypothetical protein ACA1_386370 [Acanthamoeba castellanii str. Neff]
MDEDGEGVTFASSPTALLLASHGSTSAQQLQDRLKALLTRLGHVGRSDAGDAAASLLLDDAASALLAAAPSLLRHRKHSVRQLAGACFHELGRLCALPRDTDDDVDDDRAESNDDDRAAAEGVGRESGEGEVCHSPLLQSAADGVDDGDGEIVGARRPMRFRRAKGLGSDTTKRKPPPDTINEPADERDKEVDDDDDERLARQFDDYPISASLESEVLELMKKKDWAKTSLGAPKTWPAPLKIAFECMMSSRFPMSLAWGDDFLRFYNDACITLLGDKHPAHLGTPAAEAWPEIWYIIQPMLQQVLATGRPTWVTNKLLPMKRNGFVEEVYLTWSFSAIRDHDGVPRGVMTISFETSSDVISSRQIQALQALASRGLEASTCQEVRETVFDIFAKDCT